MSRGVRFFLTVMNRLLTFALDLPVTAPVWIFFIVMIIILFAPIVLGKLKIPHIIGMILAGVLIGEHGFNILERDSSFELFGQVGLYYIMFLAGLEMDMEDFRKNKVKGLVFGLLTFFIPMGIGIWSGISLLGQSLVSATLLASMYASHTLIAYPIVSRYGLARQRSVTISIGGTAVTVTLALIVLAVISGMYKGSTGSAYWVSFAIKVTILTLATVFLLPMVGRWFFRKYEDAVMQFIFVLAMVFLGGGLMSMAGMEGILGAFLVGMVLNPLVPKVSPLMNRLEFVGNALFIPYFLIGVGMIIDVKSLFAGGEALKVAVVMTVAATLSKWLAAFFTQKIYRMSGNERMMIFGLSNAQAAATLAAVLIGHEIILENGERLLNDNVLNGTVVMILFTCVISTIMTEKAARKFALAESTLPHEKEETGGKERILIPVANPETIENLVNMALVIKNPKSKDGIIALNVINDGVNADAGESAGRRNLEKAAMIASAADVKTDMVCRYDMNIASGIVHTIKEYGATDLVIGLHQKSNFLDSFFGSLTGNLLKGTYREVMVARLMMPVNTLKGIQVIVPALAEYETGFARWVNQVLRMAGQLGCRIRFAADASSAASLRKIIAKSEYATLAEILEEEKRPFADRMDMKVRSEQLVVVVSARNGSISYDLAFDRLPALLNKNFANNSLLIVYPEQVDRDDVMTISNPVNNN